MAAEPAIRLDEPESSQEAAVPAEERRGQVRYAAGADVLVLLIEQGVELGGRLENLSLTGCRIETLARSSAQPGSRVELSFRLNQMAFRMAGWVQWSNGLRQMGVRFAELSTRFQGELQILMNELEFAAEQAAEAEAAKKAAIEAEQTIEKTGEPSKPRERRVQKRHELAETAVIYPIRSGGQLEGTILDLSLTGCRIQTQHRVSFSAYSRVEVGFHAEGLPFRIGGVVQSHYGLNQVGVRFVDVGERNQERIQMLMAELEAKDQPPAAPDC